MSVSPTILRTLFLATALSLLNAGQTLGQNRSVAGTPRASAQDFTGKRVVVIKQDARLEAGSMLVGTADVGDIYEVGKVSGEWLWIDVRNGYLKRSDVVPYEVAIDHFTAAIHRVPSASNYRDRAITFANRSELQNSLRNRKEESSDQDKALADLNEAIRLDPKFAKGYSDRGRVFIGIRDYDMALADVNEAIRLNPKESRAFLNRGKVWQAKWEWEKAIADLTESIRLDPNLTRAGSYPSFELDGRAHFYCGEAHCLRAAAWRELHRYDRAITDITEAIRLDPTNDRYLQNRAYYYCIDMKDYDKAITDLNEMIRLEPKHADAFQFRGGVWEDMRQFDKAIADYTEAIRLQPRKIAALGYRGRAYRSRGNGSPDSRDYDEALTDFNEAIRRGLLDLVVLLHRAMLLSTMGEYDGAIADLDTANQHKPYDSRPDFYRGVVRYFQGKYKMALADINTSIEKSVKLGAISGYDECQRLSVVFRHFVARRAGDETRAAEFLSKATEEKLDDRWQGHMIQFLRGEINESELLKFRNERQQIEAHILLGLDHSLKGQGANAREHLRWVIEHVPGSSIEYEIAWFELNRLAIAQVSPSQEGVPSTEYTSRGTR